MSQNSDTTSKQGSNTPIAEYTPRPAHVQAYTQATSPLDAGFHPRVLQHVVGKTPSRSLIGT